MKPFDWLNSSSASNIENIDFEKISMEESDRYESDELENGIAFIITPVLTRLIEI